MSQRFFTTSKRAPATQGTPSERRLEFQPQTNSIPGRAQTARPKTNQGSIASTETSVKRALFPKKETETEEEKIQQDEKRRNSIEDQEEDPEITFNTPGKEHFSFIIMGPTAREKARLEKLAALYEYDDADPMDDIVDESNYSAAMEIYKVRKARADENSKMATDLVNMTRTMSLQEKTPRFTGGKNEDALAHTLAVKDWQERQQWGMDEMPKKFGETLRGQARIWYNDTSVKETKYDKLINEFIREYHFQGKDNRTLKSELFRTPFDPHEHKIREFIRDAELKARVAKVENSDLLEIIKDNLPQEVYVTTRKEKEWTSFKADMVELFSSHHWAKPAQPAASSPFLAMTGDNRLNKAQQSYREDGEKQSPPNQDVLFAVDGNGNYKPYTRYPPKRGPKAKRHPRSQYEDEPVPSETRREIPHREFKRDQGSHERRPRHSKERRPRPYSKERRRGNPREWDNHWEAKEQRRYEARQKQYNPKYTKRFIGPDPKKGKDALPKSPTEAEIRSDIDRSRCHYCTEIGHWANKCPQKQKHRENKLTKTDQAYALLTNLSSHLKGRNSKKRHKNPRHDDSDEESEN